MSLNPSIKSWLDFYACLCYSVYPEASKGESMGHVLWAVGCDTRLQQELAQKNANHFQLNFSEPQNVLSQVATCQGIFLGPELNGGTDLFLKMVYGAVRAEIESGKLPFNFKGKRVFLFKREPIIQLPHLIQIPVISVDQLMEQLTVGRTTTGTTVH